MNINSTQSVCRDYRITDDDFANLIADLVNRSTIGVFRKTVVTADSGNNYISEGATGKNTSYANDNVKTFEGNDTVRGWFGNDVIQGGDGDDILFGGTGNTDPSAHPSFYTNDGNDVLIGGAGDDRLDGETGNDFLNGGAGSDELTGGVGVNTFVYSNLTDSLLDNFDRITDFKIGTDSIDGVNSVAAATVDQLGNVDSLTEVDIQAVLTGDNFEANTAATFTYGTGTFLALNDGEAGFSANNDAIIEITGYTGDLSALAIV